MKKTIELNKNETYLIYDKDTSIIIFEPTLKNTKINTKLIIPTEGTDYNLLASNIAIALLKKIKLESTFIDNLLNWFHELCISVENDTIH